MKIQNIHSLDQGVRPMGGPDSHIDDTDQALMFRRTISELSDDQFSAKIKGLVEEINKQGDRLTKKADLSEFEKYRSLIRDFMNEVVSNGFAFNKDNAFVGRGRHKFYATVKKVDEKLDELCQEVLSDHSESLEIAGKIDDIRGLLLDLML